MGYMVELTEDLVTNKIWVMRRVVTIDLFGLLNLRDWKDSGDLYL